MPGLVFETRTRRSLIAAVVLAGSYLGWEAAAHHNSKVYAASPSIKTERLSFPHSSTIAVVSVPKPLSPDQQQAMELARLQARNRRLEALVKILRQRKLEHSQLEAKR